MTLDHDAMVSKEMVRLLWNVVSPLPPQGGVRRYRANLLLSANDAILAGASAPFMPVMAPEPKRRAPALGGKRGRRFKARR